jgi:toxin ParE1/3/4
MSEPPSLPVLRTARAESDLEDILAYLEARSPAAAERLTASIEQTSQRLSQFPLMGRSREELAPELRSIVVGHYVLFYRVQPDRIEVLRILHGRRDIEHIMKEPEEEE